MGTNELKKCTVRKKIFSAGPTRAGRKSLVPILEHFSEGKENIMGKG
jgi:hypothetical protein